MTRKLVLSIAAVLLQGSVWAQTPVGTAQTPAQEEKPGIERREEPFLVELGGFTNFVNNDYGRWSGANAKVMYRGAKHFAPILGFASQTRPAGSQVTFGLDSYILVSKWFYAIAGIGGSPAGSAVLWPKLRYGATGMITIPRVQGLVGTVGASKIDGERGSYGRILNAGALYYRGQAIWSGYVSFNRNYPGALPSKAGGVAVQYGAEKKYWIGGGITGGRIAYQTISLTPLDVRFVTFGPNAFYSRWLSRNRGFTVRYDYQDQLDAYQRHGIALSIFFELP